jgi:hypothetical protein
MLMSSWTIYPTRTGSGLTGNQAQKSAQLEPARFYTAHSGTRRRYVMSFARSDGGGMSGQSIADTTGALDGVA